MIKRILSGCLVIGIVAAMIGFQFIFPYSLNIIMALITATAVFELVSAVGLRKYLTFLLPSVAFALAIPLIPNQMYWSMVTYFLYTIFMLGSTHISLQKGQVSGYLCGIRHDIVGYNRIEYSISDEILKSTALYAVCGNGVVCRMDCEMREHILWEAL